MVQSTQLVKFFTFVSKVWPSNETETCEGPSRWFSMALQKAKWQRHRVEMSLSKGCIFEGSNLSVSEILKTMYWWSLGMPQKQIQQQPELSSQTTCAWHKKCREVCEYILLSKASQIGGKLKDFCHIICM